MSFTRTNSVASAIRRPSKKRAGVSFAFNLPNNVITNVVPGWNVYTFIRNTIVTATVLYPTTINVCCVGGGGDGGGYNSVLGGGGGGGRMVEVAKTLSVSQTITIVDASGDLVLNGVGGNSTVTFSEVAVGNIVAGGGGSGSSAGSSQYNAPLTYGGSGGGGGTFGTAATVEPGGNTYAGNTSVIGTACKGGTSALKTSAGGGGGAGGVGANGSSNVGGNGGAGIKPSLNGIKDVYTTAVFCGGGGGNGNSTGGQPGCTGAGTGTVGTNAVSSAQKATGYGCGGGGKRISDSTWLGGPGVVIIAIPS